MADWRDDRDFAETVRSLLGIVADEHYEGWSDYWDDQQVFEGRVYALFDEWERLCKAPVVPAPRSTP